MPVAPAAVLAEQEGTGVILHHGQQQGMTAAFAVGVEIVRGVVVGGGDHQHVAGADRLAGLDVDGEPLGRLPARIEIRPGAVTLIGCSSLTSSASCW